MDSAPAGITKKEDCPLNYALNIIGGKWRLPIIWAL
ncbi:winged helix-turn-helix transcriptional regulator [Neobacillus sp. D3-1R]